MGDLGIKNLLLTTADREDISSLYAKLEEIGLVEDKQDMTVWTSDLKEVFSISFYYDFYASFRIPFGLRNRYDDVVRLVWNSELPYKIKVFGCRIFAN